MGEDGRDLWHELSGLADAFADLGRKLLHASRQLHAPGALPEEALITEFASLRAAFDSARDETLGRAERLSVPTPPDGPPGNLKALAALLDAVDEAEARRHEQAEQTAYALTIVDRVLRLVHVREADFEPLRACQDRARTLRRALADGGVADPAGSVRPFADLLAMLEGTTTVGDDLWGGLFDSVAAAFGKPLAAALVRTRVVDPAAVAEPHAEGSEAPCNGATPPEADATEPGHWSESTSVIPLPRGIAALLAERQIAHTSTPQTEPPWADPRPSEKPPRTPDPAVAFAAIHFGGRVRRVHAAQPITGWMSRFPRHVAARPAAPGGRDKPA